MNDADVAVDTSDWDRLPARMLLVHVARLALSLAPVAVLFLVLEDVPGSGLVLLALFGMSVRVLRDLATVVVTRYRIDDERVQLRTGLFTTSHLSIPRDRIRAVDVTARPIHRIFGLAVVRVGTGEQARIGSTGDLALDAISARDAEQLRARLLLGTGAAAAAEASDAGSVLPGTETLATLQWRWIGWSILSWWTLVLPAFMLGSLYQLLRSAGLEPDDVDVVDGAVAWVQATSIGVVAALGVPLVVLVGVLARMATFVETWWCFRLWRESDGTLGVRRGLFTQRSTSLQEQRIRGAALTEPVLLRPFTVGSAQVVTTGLADAPSGATGAGSTSLGPPALLREVDQVVSAVLHETSSPVSARGLASHPRAALRRRVGRAAMVTAVAWGLLVLACASAGPPAQVLALGVGIVVALTAGVVAIDSWRSLGHRLTPRHLVTRRGVFVRRTVALQRDGIVGWIGTRTIFQRRVGLLTLTATTAAGTSAYAVVDVGEAMGVELAHATVPGLLTPFLEPPREPAPAGAGD